MNQIEQILLIVGFSCIGVVAGAGAVYAIVKLHEYASRVINKIGDRA